MPKPVARAVGGALAAAALLATTACQGAEPTPAASPSTSTSTRPPASQDQPVPAPTGSAAEVDANHSVEADEPEPAPLPSPTPDEASNALALETATAAMTAFAQPGASEEQWWAALGPHLSDAAREAYSATDPANVPASAVTGAASVLPSDSGYLAVVAVPTDVGVYEVLLSRAGQFVPWSVEQLTPPEGVN